MANKSTTESAASAGALQRGKACLRCRKRKMRCTGERPSCGQCIRAKKGDGCEYDDGKGKTRTQILRDNIQRLEQRVRELEDPDYTSPAVMLFNPHQRSASSSSSITGSPTDSGMGQAHSPYLSDSTDGSWSHLPISQSPPASPFDGEMYFDEPQPPFELALMLFDIFAPHRHQTGLGIHLDRLRESITLPLAEQRHPVLMNAIFLWACFISRPEPLAQHEDHYLGRALDALTDALKSEEYLLDAIQASCLLSVYFLSNGRVLEGCYHANAAASLSVQAGLHESVFRDTPKSSFLNSPSVTLPQARDSIEQGERILAFWQVYNLDRCWSVIFQKPLAMPESRSSRICIQTPWPQSMADYETGRFDDSIGFGTVGQFLDGVLDAGFSPMALRAKASSLFERADHLSTTLQSLIADSKTLNNEIRTLEHTIEQFVSTLIPVHQLDGIVLEDRCMLIVTHTLAHAAMIHLHELASTDDALSYSQSLRSARSCVNIVKTLNEADFAFLDPIIGPCWSLAADALLRELTGMDAAWPLLDSSGVQNELGALLYALTALSDKFPLLRLSAAKIQKRLGQR